MLDSRDEVTFEFLTPFIYIHISSVSAMMPASAYGFAYNGIPGAAAASGRTNTLQQTPQGAAAAAAAAGWSRFY